jgi:hypothetical protein
LFGRFTMANVTGPTTNPSQTAIDPEFAVGFLDRQRNAAVAYTRTPSPTFTMESGISFTRTTPSFPTLDRTDPALTFGDGSYEAFNAAAGSVMAPTATSFRFARASSGSRGKHTFKAGGEVRGNRDTTVFGISPNGAIPVRRRNRLCHGAHPLGERHARHRHRRSLPDALTGLLERQCVRVSTSSVAPSHVRPRRQHRRFRHPSRRLQRSTSRTVGKRRTLTLNYGLRYEIESRIREADKRTSAPVLGSWPGRRARFGIADQPRSGLQARSATAGDRVSLDWRAASPIPPYT